MTYRSLEDLEAGLDEVRQAPANRGVVEMIVCRPDVGERKVLDEGRLDLTEGLVGDNWRARGHKRTTDGLGHPDMQLTITNARAIQLVARARNRWPLAGDQLYIDLDVSAGNLPPGTRLAIGAAVVEVTDQPHTGCRKFAERFGVEAVRFFATPVGRSLNLRGINTRVVQPGTVRVGDVAVRV